MNLKRHRPKPKLERRNAAKNIDYEPRTSSLWSPSWSISSSHYFSLDGETRFRVQGAGEGEFHRICRSLGLSGPEDFAIPPDEWEAQKNKRNQDLADEFGVSLRVRDESASEMGDIAGVRTAAASGEERLRLTWGVGNRGSVAMERDGEEKGVTAIGCEGGIGELSGLCSFSTSNEGGEDDDDDDDDDDSWSTTTTTEGMCVVSPEGSFRRNIVSWSRGELLGRGSFGKVYEGISDGGYFFAVKEVSLLDQGSQAQQCIRQLEQEISLLSQFEHENIVQYLGTDKEEAKLYIFLELVTKGSLASLYQKYRLRDSQVSVYTRQILNGLKYLHDRNVVHRDIKCANILVDANGSVKLADFGLAKETSKLSMLKSCKGSAYWMAPEVVNPRKTYGPAADIWSLGCTVLEMLTHQLPHYPLEWTQAIFKIGRGEAPHIPNSLSRDAQDLIARCLQVIPANRPSASELLNHPFVKKELQSS